MKKHIPEVDAYIDKAEDFAKPILLYLRNLIHESCPNCEEAIKWSYPHFMYHGKILASISAFKHYCYFGFWLQDELKTLEKITKNKEKTSIYSLGKIRKIDDLPPKPLLKTIILEAMELTDMGITLKKNVSQTIELQVPDYFATALAEFPVAKEKFDTASPSFRKEYIKWIIDAKTETTKNNRIRQAIEWISEGKGRNWKYEKKK